ncbi:SH2B adapter protein 2 [Frankliniella fusca]|uniref:SH2B adapter protein 2 n=1 Tax=Frankliniella fusca TaxID=407009 RepID=A0AAE1GSL2_9NEOP|nr:SH2B adapter protein 2 [Frankliniella fusca]
MASVSPESNWVEFCDKHAKSAAAEFANAFTLYTSSHMSDSARHNISHKEFLRKFIDCFQDHFEAEFGSQNASTEKSLANGAVGHDDLSDYSEHDTDMSSPKPQQKPFFRRLSFKGLKKGKAFFHKQNSDEVELSHSDKKDKHSKTKLAKIVVECRKEGIVNYLSGENLDGTGKWDKCRLALVKTVSGYMLEFYSPPKAPKPRSGVFCFLILEARETTALEMPDKENTFVLKAENQQEYVIEAHDTDDMKSWLATIKYCMRSTTQPVSEHPETSSRQGGPCSKASAPPIDGDSLEHPPELPPRVTGAGRSAGDNSLRLSSNSNFDICSSQTDIAAGGEGDADLSCLLRDFPWFHGTLPRSEAAQLVLSGGSTGHGVFLVRQSETRKGEFVLTFNFQGRAKHLRMTLNEQGQCRVQHLWFQAIFDMLEHFREHPIPLESGGTADVTLTDYIVSTNHALSTPSTSVSRAPTVSPPTPSTPSTVVVSLGSTPVDPRPRPLIVDGREVMVLGGSVRTRTESLEQIPSRQNQSTGRAVENTYSFV